ncbi:MAG TPA: hypothetical protein VF071_00730 [Candidatus Limnocylindria bacterium]
MVRAIRPAVGFFVGAVLLTTLAVPTAPARAVELSAVAMCNGRTDPNIKVIAHARPSATVPRYVVNVWTDATGAPFGALVVDQDGDRIVVDQWCRVWQHLPDQPGGQCSEEVPEGAITAHAVGLGTHAEGRSVIVRTDVRATDEGLFFRVRYRVPESHDAAIAADDGGCGDEGGCGEGDEHEGGCEDGWTRLPAEGWYPLRQLSVRAVGE